jgi:thioredoxin-dependent peroxiredoxin
VAFRDLKADFDRLGYAVVGISPDKIPDLDTFKANNDLPFIFLSDEGATYADRVGVWVEKSNYGKTYMGIARSTFVVGADGTVEAVYFNVRPQDHAEFVRDALAAAAQS